MEITATSCRICNTKDHHKHYTVQEMMFGTKENFDYFQCNNCKCLQISEIPINMSRFYPSNYYSYSQTESHNKKSFIINFLIKTRVNTALFNKNYKLSKLASYVTDLPPQFFEVADWLKKCQVKSFNTSFLDIGCGTSSWWLNALKSLGFKNLQGADPFIDKTNKENGIKILKTNIEDITDKYDVISLHHSFEHIPNQLATLKAIKSLLNPGGFCLIRIPLVNSKVWDMYGVDWVELDAPRHFYLHSIQSLTLLAEEANFKLVDFSCDSTEFEFVGSEQYRRNIPLTADNSFYVNSSKSDFTYKEISHFKKIAEEANNSKTCGRGCFILRKTN